MKNLRKNLFVVVLLFGTISMNANTASEDLDIKPSVTILRYGDVKEGYEVSIKDNSGIVLYNESIQKDGQYVKGFDLTTLPEGDYSFELDKSFEIQIKPFMVLEGNVKFLNEGNYTIFKPVIRKKDGLVFVSQLTFDANVKIEISNRSNTILHSELVDTKLGLRRIFDFSNLPINDYKIVIKTQNRRFVNHITL